MPRCTIVSFRFGLTDGVSVVSRNWAVVLRRLGFDVSWVAGAFESGWEAGDPTHLVAGLGIDDPMPPDVAALTGALAHADLVIVENLCSIPLNLPAARAVTGVLRGRPAILHHHDPPWQRQRFEHITELPPDDPAWLHVTVNDLTRREMADRGIEATTVYNGFDSDPPTGDRAGTRRRLGLDDDTLLVAHPVRAIRRKAISRAVGIAEALGGTYWLLGPAEDGYGPTLAGELAAATCPVIHAPVGTQGDIYAAADLIVFPSTWEGFGNPPVEAALYRRPVVVGNYPVATELRGLGFRWFTHDDLDTVASWLGGHDQARRDGLLDHNRDVAVRQLSLERMARRLESLLDGAGWLP